MYYLILLLIITLITLVAVKLGIDIKKDKRYLLFIVIILTVFLGIRGKNVGMDMKNYYEFFVTAKNNTFGYIIQKINFEIGFKIYTKIITLFTKNFRIYIFITSVLSMLGIYSFIKDNSKNYFASIFIFIAFNYYIYLFCTLRQGLAISILLFSLKALQNNQNKKFFLLVLLATLFHKTAIVFVLLYFVRKVPLKKKYMNIYLLGCILLFVLKNPLIRLFTELIYNQYNGYRDMSGSGYSMLILIFGAIFAICYLFRQFKIYNKDNRLLVYMLLLSFPFQILSTSQGLVARIVLYFTLSFIVLVPNFIESFNDKDRCKLQYAYYISLTLFFILEVITNGMYVPYSFV